MQDQPPTIDLRPPQEEPPPIGGTWVRLYAIVIGELALLVLLFHLFTTAFE